MSQSDFKSLRKGEGEVRNTEPEGEKLCAAPLFYATLKEKMNIGEIAGYTFATFLDILFLTDDGL
jgi:structure-specific recognition protein 1